MGVHYVRTTWHYSDRRTMPPFAIAVDREIDSRSDWYMGITVTVFSDEIDNARHTLWFGMRRHERLDAFASRVWNEVRIKGMLSADDYEYERFLDVLIWVISDKRQPRQSEIIND